MSLISTTNSAFNTTSPKTISVAVAAGDVLVVKASTEDVGATIATPTNNGAALTWTLAQSITTTDYATAYVWTATADTARTIIITLTRAGSAYIYGGSVEVWRGVTVGASAKATASGAPSVAVTTTAAGSALSVVSADWNSVDGASRAWRTTAGAVVENLYAYPAGGGPWYGATHADVGAVGSKTVGLSAPTGQKYSIIVAELAPSGSGATYAASGTVAAVSAVAGSGHVQTPSPSWVSGAWTIRRHTYGRNTIRYAGGGSGTISVSRTTTFTDGTVETVTVSGAGALDAAVPVVLVDGDVPFGAKVASIVYRCAAVSITVEVESRRWSVLSDPITGTSVTVVGAELGDLSYTSAGSVSWRPDSPGSDPLVDQRPEMAPAETLAFYTTTRAAAATVAALCLLRRPLLLRSPDGGTEDTWLALVGDRTVARVTRRSAEAWRRHAWTVQRLSRQQPDALHTADTVGDLEALYGPTATWATVVAAYPSGTVGDLAVAIIETESVVAL